MYPPRYLVFTVQFDKSCISISAWKAIEQCWSLHYFSCCWAVPKFCLVHSKMKSQLWVLNWFISMIFMRISRKSMSILEGVIKTKLRPNNVTEEQLGSKLWWIELEVRSQKWTRFFSMRGIIIRYIHRKKEKINRLLINRRDTTQCLDILNKMSHIFQSYPKGI